MSVGTPSWSEATIRPDAQTPGTVLHDLEPSLNEKTKGILQTQVTTTFAGEMVEHHLDLIAPRLEYRITLLAARHTKDLVYPVIIQSRGFLPIDTRTRVVPLSLSAAKLASIMQKLAEKGIGGLDADEQEAASEDEFRRLVQQVLDSPYTISLTHSLIARSNEKSGNGAPQGNPQ